MYIKTFRHNITKCELCNKEIFQIKFNYNFISVSLLSDMSIIMLYVNNYDLKNTCEICIKCILNKLQHSFFVSL